MPRQERSPRERGGARIRAEVATRGIRSRRNKYRITSTEVRRCQQGHAVLVRSEVERLEAHGVREEFTAGCKTQTSDLTVAVETGSRSEGRVLSNSELPASLSRPRPVISLDVFRSRRS